MCYFILRTFVIYEWSSIKSSTTSNVIYIISINPFWLHIVNFSMNVFCNDFNIFSNCWIFFFHFIILEENNMSIQNTIMKCLKITRYLKYRYILKHWIWILVFDAYIWFYFNRYWGIEGTVVTAWLAVDDSDVKNGCLQVIPGTL